MSELDDLKQEYIQNLRARLKTLSELRGQFSARPEQVRGTVRGIVHKVRGSAGIYGFASLSIAAQDLEDSSPADFLQRFDAFLKHGQEVLDSLESSPFNILVVEDDPDIHRFLKAKLAGTGAQIWVAATGQAAQTTLRENPVHLVFLDLNLPDMDGRRLIEAARADPQMAQVPIVVLSGIQAKQVHEECLRLGAESFIQKPFDASVLIDIVRNAKAVRSVGGGRDPRTGLRNRQLLELLFHKLQVERETSNLRVSLSSIEIENLPDIVTEHGASAAEGLLKHVSSLLEERLAKSDITGLVSSSQMIILAPGKPAAQMAEQLRQVVEELSKTRFEVSEIAFFRVKARSGSSEVEKGASLSDAVERISWGATPLSEPTPRPEPKRRPEVLRLLAVDDDEMITSFIRHRLVRDGYQVAIACDGAQGLQAAQRETADLIILDIQMPGLNGLELLRRLRAMPQYSKTPVIMLTALGSEADIVQAFESGANDYLVKPFSPVELNARIRRLLG